MTIESVTEFHPDYEPEHPGAILEMILGERGIKKVEFADRCGRPIKTISEIISGKNAITPDTALQFERVLGESAQYWLRLEAKFRLEQARKRERIAAQTQDATDWVQRFPFKNMVRLGFLPATSGAAAKFDALLRFFGVSSISAWDRYWENRISFAKLKQHTHHPVDVYAMAAWLRRGEIIGASLKTKPYDEANFRAALRAIRRLTKHPWHDIESDFIELAADAGVAVALVPMFPKSGLRGAASWMRKDKALIVLSDYYKSEERVWFSFFHEAAHILLHSKKAVFVDYNENGSAERKIEDEADAFSAETLIPSTEIRKFCQYYGRHRNQYSPNSLKEFAASIDISPGLLLARLQHEGVIDQGTRLTKSLRRPLRFSAQS